ncbi:major facilitator superfamily domain-containing protein [Kickxella alabastrina]|uniref:major facilitator superfamily domain-containing protein n=1 Tax=Kickxella alabastrina TaxID=61397 RepID=UPI00221FE818|nr:major facilitator superfamily domain-containing protein [Kickxella alabastrina]KAI7833818.1 major facilitator superfamily domain-containing protein [Kickxella alabastrina]
MGILGAVFGLSTTIGPLVGGFMADNWTWRISFYINIPLVCLSIISILLFVHPNTFSEKIARVDFFGALMLVTGLMLLLLGLNWGGRVYPWVSPVVIICICVGLLLLCVFVFIEGKLALEPIIDPRILRHRNVALSILAELCVGAVFFNTTFNLPVYYSFTQNSSASESGVRMVPLACGVVVSSIISGWLIAIFSAYRLAACAGAVIMTLGAGLLCLFDGHISTGAQVPILALLGSGIGCCIQALLLTAQATVRSTDLAITTALVTFSQMLGGIMGLAFGSIHYLDILIDVNPKYATDIIKAQSNAKEQSIISAYAKGFQYSFIMITCLAAVVIIFAACLQAMSQHKPPPTPEPSPSPATSIITQPMRRGFDLNRMDHDEATLAW